ncbi:MAG TPA: hypothetical protein DCZ76_12875 [Treponema sp.]|nr:hypothetical protein [Treponema sp.]
MARKIMPYEEYISKLSWHRTESEQKEAIRFLTQAPDWDFSNCIRKSSKDIWENLVAVIKKRSYEEKVQLAGELLYLLMDLNWPGALQALGILKGIRKEDILPPLESALKSACLEKDGNWLSYLYELVVHFELSDSDFKEITLGKIIALKDW